MALDIVSHMTQTANPVTFLASPLGEEGHEVAKGWTVVILIMILDVDVTAEGGIIKLIAAERQSTTLGPKGRCPLSASEHNPPPTGGHNPRAKGPSTLMCAFCIECASQPKLALSLPIKGPSYCRLTVRRRVQGP